jgi:hypothetical protein
MKITSKEAIAKLKSLGIHTTSDLDKYSLEHVKEDSLGRRYCDSRYGTLKTLVGEKVADLILQELMVKSW